MTGLYGEPRYYDVAFSYRDFDGEVAVMTACSRLFGTGTPRHVLEICCGQAPHIEAWVKQGLASYTGIDASPTMLGLARDRARSLAAPAQFLQCDLADFALAAPADFACTLLASLYARDTAHLEAHFSAVARALVPGGLYFMEWSVDFDPMVDIVDSWEVERDGIHIKASYWTCCVNRVEQTYEDTIHLQIDERGVQRIVDDRAVRRRIFPQEFLAFIDRHPAFEFIGWWNDWDLNQPIDGSKPVNRPIIVIRKT
ncbi:MAG: class I SAM-dependent methyltransferase [Candidatus Hydrogenedentes bacterium]|nr:class I SAM-dependent methyltransferase [Candidatus Hydrogenedentota bacterium]